jgi:hypothetical protein
MVKPSLNLATQVRGSTSQLDETCKPAQWLDKIKKFAITFAEIVRIHNFKQDIDYDFTHKILIMISHIHQ